MRYLIHNQRDSDCNLFGFRYTVYLEDENDMIPVEGLDFSRPRVVNHRTFSSPYESHFMHITSILLCLQWAVKDAIFRGILTKVSFHFQGSEMEKYKAEDL